MTPLFRACAAVITFNLVSKMSKRDTHVVECKSVTLQNILTKLGTLVHDAYGQKITSDFLTFAQKFSSNLLKFG